MQICGWHYGFFTFGRPCLAWPSKTLEAIHKEYIMQDTKTTTSSTPPASSKPAATAQTPEQKAAGAACSTNKDGSACSTDKSMKKSAA
jgi:hypothetical protein